MQRRRRKPKHRKETGKRLRINHQIRASQVRLIDEAGKNLGVFSISEALKKAEEKGLDLVEVSPLASPPVTRIVDWGQYKYEREKRERKLRVKQKKIEVKGVRLSFRIKGQDLDTRKDQAQRFLSLGHQVQIEMVLKGREKTHRDLALGIIKNFVKSLEEEVRVVQPFSEQGGRLSMVVSKK